MAYLQSRVGKVERILGTVQSRQEEKREYIRRYAAAAVYTLAGMNDLSPRLSPAVQYEVDACLTAGMDDPDHDWQWESFNSIGPNPEACGYHRGATHVLDVCFWAGYGYLPGPLEMPDSTFHTWAELGDRTAQREYGCASCGFVLPCVSWLSRGGESGIDAKRVFGMALDLPLMDICPLCGGEGIGGNAFHRLKQELPLYCVAAGAHRIAYDFLTSAQTDEIRRNWPAFPEVETEHRKSSEWLRRRAGVPWT